MFWGCSGVLGSAGRSPAFPCTSSNMTLCCACCAMVLPPLLPSPAWALAHAPVLALNTLPPAAILQAATRQGTPATRRDTPSRCGTMERRPCCPAPAPLLLAPAWQAADLTQLPPSNRLTFCTVLLLLCVAGSGWRRPRRQCRTSSQAHPRRQRGRLPHASRCAFPRPCLPRHPSFLVPPSIRHPSARLKPAPPRPFASHSLHPPARRACRLPPGRRRAPAHAQHPGTQQGTAATGRRGERRLHPPCWHSPMLCLPSSPTACRPPPLTARSPLAAHPPPPACALAGGAGRPVQARGRRPRLLGPLPPAVRARGVAVALNLLAHDLRPGGAPRGHQHVRPGVGQAAETDQWACQECTPLCCPPYHTTAPWPPRYGHMFACHPSAPTAIRLLVTHPPARPPAHRREVAALPSAPLSATGSAAVARESPLPQRGGGSMAPPPPMPATQQPLAPDAGGDASGRGKRRPAAGKRRRSGQESDEDYDPEVRV